MTGLSNTLGRGLLILALGSCAFACGDDDGGGSKPDSGPEAGTGGGGGAGNGGDGGAGSGSVDVAACVADAKAITMGMTTDTCLTCGCTEGGDKVTACDATCWGLIDCFADSAKCGDVDASDMTAAVSCLSMKCPTLLAGAAMSSAQATALGTVLSGPCATQCAPPAAGPDAGTDASTPDTDGGDTDGGS